MEKLRNRLLLLFFIAAGAAAQADQQMLLNEVLDDFHRAAAEADFERYTALMSDDIVFLGTDASERWQGADFPAFARPYFDAPFRPHLKSHGHAPYSAFHRQCSP